MKKSKKQSNLKVLATTSALIGVCCVGTGLNAETASASTTRIPTVNTSNQANNPSFGSRLWTNLKRPFSATGKFFGRTWDSIRNCFGLKKTNSTIQEFEMNPVSNSDKSKTLKRGAVPPNKTSSKINTNSSSKQSKPDVTYADLDFNGSNSSNGIRPRTEPQTIYTQIKTGGSSKQPQDVTYASLNFNDSNSTSGIMPRTEPQTIYAQIKPQNPNKSSQMTVTVDVHAQSSGDTTPSIPPKSSTPKSGTNNQGFDDDNSPNKSSNQNYLVLTTSGGSSSSAKPKKLFYDPQFDTDEFGSNPDKDPIYQPIGDFTSTSQPQTQTSSTNSGGGNKPPVPAPRTKLQTKQ